MLDAADILLLLVTFAVGGAIGYALASRRPDGTTVARRELVTRRREYLESLFDRLQRLHWAIETELSADRRTVLGDERGERVDAIIEQLREADLFFRSKRFLIDEAHVEAIDEALATSWRALSGFEVEAGGDADERAYALLAEALERFEESLRIDVRNTLGEQSGPGPVQEAQRDLSAEPVEPAGPERPARPQPERPGRRRERSGRRQVNLPAEPAPEEPPPAPPPTTMISLD